MNNNRLIQGVKFLIACGIFALALVLPVPAVRAAACDAADPAFVCGLRNAEDLVRLTGTPWIVVSQFNFEPPRHFGAGPLNAVRFDTREVRRLYPTSESAVDWDRDMYPDCKAPPENFSSVGLNVRPLTPGRFRLYVTHRGERDSIEIIDVAVMDKRVRTSWRGCIRAPVGVRPNGVVPLPQGAVALSGGGLAIWRPGHAWSIFEGLEGGNGVEASRDGQWLFVALSSKYSVVRVPVRGSASRTVLTLDFLPDNLRWGEDGSLYVAGPRFPNSPRDDVSISKSVAECFKRSICDVGFAVARIDMDRLTTQTVFNSDGIKGAFGAATTALQVGRHLWIGSVRADRVALFDFKPQEFR